MEAKAKNPLVTVLEDLLDNHPDPMPAGAPEGIPPAVNVQFTIIPSRGNGAPFTSRGAVRRSPYEGVFVATVIATDKNNAPTGSAECWFVGDELAGVLVRQNVEAEKKVVLAAADAIPPARQGRPIQGLQSK